MGLGLVGCILQYMSTGKLFIFSRNYLALGGIGPPTVNEAQMYSMSKYQA